jgi:hypothetical protein
MPVSVIDGYAVRLLVSALLIASAPWSIAGMDPGGYQVAGLASPVPSNSSEQVMKPADAAARVIASDERFAGVVPLLAATGSESAWYEASQSDAGYLVTITLGWGDCSAGCEGKHMFQFQVATDGTFAPPVESGDPLPVDFTPLSGAGDAPVDIALIGGPTCPVESTPPDPACAGRPIAGATVVVHDSGGVEIGRMVSDVQGHARGSLPTGTYVFGVLPVAGLFSPPEAVAASVLGPMGVRLVLAYDTGLR